MSQHRQQGAGLSSQVCSCAYWCVMFFSAALESESWFDSTCPASDFRLWPCLNSDLLSRKSAEKDGDRSNRLAVDAVTEQSAG